VICPHESGAGKTFAAVKDQQRSKNNTWTRKTEDSKDMEEEISKRLAISWAHMTLLALFHFAVAKDAH